MAITVVASGTQTAVVGTEHVLNDDTTDSGVFVGRVNLVNMAAGDVVELRMYSRVLSGDTEAVVYKATFYNAADADSVVQQSVPVTSDIGAKYTLKQVAGTGRNFPWSLLKM